MFRNDVEQPGGNFGFWRKGVRELAVNEMAVALQAEEKASRVLIHFLPTNLPDHSAPSCGPISFCLMVRWQSIIRNFLLVPHQVWLPVDCKCIAVGESEQCRMLLINSKVDLMGNFC